VPVKSLAQDPLISPPISAILKESKEHTPMNTNTATRSIDDLTTREREFFFRALRENDNAATDWEFEGFCDLCGRFGFWGVKNPRHSFDG